MDPPTSIADPFNTACNFIKACSQEQDMKVTVTAVDNGLCSIPDVKLYAQDVLGADSFKIRSYTP